MKRFILVTIAVFFSLTVIAQPTDGSSNANVKGRKVVGLLPKPSYAGQTEGIVVVQVKVDQYGTVTDAVPGAEGTTATDKNLWAAARNAALKAHFNMDANAPAVQTGTITYVFKMSPNTEAGSSDFVIQEEITHIKDIVDAQGHDVYTIRAKYVKTHKLNKLIFLVEEEDYIIPIQLVKNDLGAEKRFLSLNLQAGDSLMIKGTLSKIGVDYEDYNGLIDAVIVKMIAMHQPQDQAPESVSDTVPFQIVEQKPSFHGGDANEFSKWVNENLVYPPRAKQYGIQGRVTVQFTVKADGNVSDVHVMRGIDSDLDQEAVRVISHSPKWTPGRNKGKPVDVTYTFPVIFQFR